jgi:hypothetical protein
LAKGVPEVNINDEVLSMVKQTPLALELIVGLIEAGKISETDFNSQTQHILAGAKFADTTEGQALSREIMEQRTGAGPAASVASAEGSRTASSSTATDVKVSDAYILAMAVERPVVLDPESLRALHDAIKQLNETQYAAFVKRYEEMASGLGDQKSHCGEFFINKSKAQAIEAMNTILSSAEVEGPVPVASETIAQEQSTEAVPAEEAAEAAPEEKQAEAVQEEEQAEEKPVDAPNEEVSQEQQAAPAVSAPEPKPEEPGIMGSIRKQLDTISKKFNDDWQSKTGQLERYYVALQEYIRELKADQYSLLSEECESRLSGLADDQSGSPLSELYSQLASAPDPTEANNRITKLISDLRSA